jgi:hypothetical protein
LRKERRLFQEGEISLSARGNRGEHINKGEGIALEEAIV